MRILDIDLDFFLTKKPGFHYSSSNRLSSKDYRPWSKEDVQLFIETKCGLSLKRHVPGCVVESHDNAFFFWKRLIQQKKISAPFEVVHVDSHADIGLGDLGYLYLMDDILSLPITKRTSPKTGNKFMNEGNYLAFAIACQWISKLTYVHHPKGGKDLMKYHFKGFDTMSGFIQLKNCDKKNIVKVARKCLPLSETTLGVIKVEPEVPFIIINGDSFSTSDTFDYLVLSKSPSFTPKESDSLIPIIRRYIKNI